LIIESKAKRKFIRVNFLFFAKKRIMTRNDFTIRKLEKLMRLLFIGDVVGSLGRTQITEYVPRLKRKYHPQLTIINGENAASGRGITEKIYKKFLQDGADVVTMGNHTWDNRDIFEFIDDAKKLVRPANFPEDTTPGQGIVYIKVNTVEVAVINLQGRTFMNDLDDPFRKIEAMVDEAKKRTPIVFVDFHAETTSEKQAMGWWLDGKASAVVGTHTHVQTNDARILPGGTGYLTDVGMTGPYDGILGMKRDAVINKFITALPNRFEVVEEGRFILSGVVIDIDDVTGKTKKMELVQISDDRPFRE
jgi:metallophosphoesterase (TIGR00282 family)